MNRRRRLLVFGLLAVTASLGAGALLLWPAGSVTHENYDRLYYGMTLRHACGILGPPSDSVGPGDIWFISWARSPLILLYLSGSLSPRPCLGRRK
jgi:hypothetical protein